MPFLDVWMFHAILSALKIHPKGFSLKMFFSLAICFSLSCWWSKAWHNATKHSSRKIKFKGFHHSCKEQHKCEIGPTVNKLLICWKNCVTECYQEKMDFWLQHIGCVFYSGLFQNIFQNVPNFDPRIEKTFTLWLLRYSAFWTREMCTNEKSRRLAKCLSNNFSHSCSAKNMPIFPQQFCGGQNEAKKRHESKKKLGLFLVCAIGLGKDNSLLIPITFWQVIYRKTSKQGHKVIWNHFWAQVTTKQWLCPLKNSWRANS